MELNLFAAGLGDDGRNKRREPLLVQRARSIIEQQMYRYRARPTACRPCGVILVGVDGRYVYMIAPATSEPNSLATFAKRFVLAILNSTS